LVGSLGELLDLPGVFGCNWECLLIGVCLDTQGELRGRRGEATMEEMNRRDAETQRRFFVVVADAMTLGAMGFTSAISNRRIQDVGAPLVGAFWFVLDGSSCAPSTDGALDAHVRGESDALRWMSS